MAKVHTALNIDNCFPLIGQRIIYLKSNAKQDFMVYGFLGRIEFGLCFRVQLYVV